MASGSDYQGASIILVGAPLDATVSFRPGTRFGPRAIREMSYCLEEYSPDLGHDLGEVSFYDAGDLVFPLGYLDACLATIETAAEKVLGDGKLPVFLGGEHLITLPLVKAAARYHPDLAVIQLDAHADLRDEYLGARLSHATVMRRVVEVVGPENVIQLGIRSAVREEVQYAGDNTLLFFHEVVSVLEDLLPSLRGRPVYVTIDIDIADPAYAPGVGTPEPGGIEARELLQAVYFLYELNVIGLDLVEVNPAYDHRGQTALLAAKVLREAILCLGYGRRGKIKIVNGRNRNRG
ncbi:MAG: agmatinase [Peptococcaceae bacterium]|nr:agmatinase [Peptococcaceae bacterium]